MRDTQDGFAGQTGTIWTIAQDCRFSVAHQIGAKVTEPYHQGRLTPEQEARLKELLARTPIADMPEQLGAGPEVNARRLTLSYDGKVSVLMLPAGGGDLSALRSVMGEGPAGRLLGLADTLKGMTGG